MSEPHPHADHADMAAMTIPSMGFSATFLAPTTVAKYNQLAKDEDACRRDAVYSTAYRSTLNDFREGIFTALEKETGILRETEETGKKDSEGNAILQYTQTEKEYVKAVLAKLNKKPEDFKHIEDLVNASLVFDPSATERKATGPKKIAKAYIAAAQTLIDKGVASAAAAKLSTLLGRTIEPTLESLSGAISEDQRKKDVANEYSS